jgi:hypothetical protein
MVAAPTMDKGLYEQVANADVTIEGIYIDTPSSRQLIVEAPDGMIGMPAPSLTATRKPSTS